MRDAQRNCERHSCDKESGTARWEQGEAEVGIPGLVVLVALVVSSAALILAGTLVLPALPVFKAASIKWHFRHIFSAVVIALVNNVDNLGARLAYSVQGTKVPLLVNAWISIITLLISSCAAYFGGIAGAFLGQRFASLLSMAMLMTLGLWMIGHAVLRSWHVRIHEKRTSTTHLQILEKPHHADIDDSKHIDFGEGTVLGVALSINNVGGGMTAGIIGIAPWLVGCLSASISFAALLAGNHVADFFIRKHISDQAAFIGGAAMILLALKQLI